MNAQLNRNPFRAAAAATATPALRHIEPGQALHLGRLGGELTVLEGRRSEEHTSELQTL